MTNPTHWEYKVVSVGSHFGTADEVVEAKLNELGREGWEALILLAPGGGKVSITLKRPLTDTNRRRRAREQEGT